MPAALFAAAPALAWSLLLSGAVVVLSLVPLGAGRASADFTPADLAAPRAMFERLPAWGQRASWAHQNSFEAFTLHAPACLLCLQAGAGGLPVTVAALLQPLLRLAYIGAYVGDVPLLRSLCWAGALLSTALLYLEGLRAVLAA
ncbi:MAPEG family protein [Synechococcus sp. CS-205]|uniref:MAPEG family protein n=1 Tax=Synechococcus sp. CS-205 TaxID=2847984 RepID=UPI00223C0193|nr:MAPEG family protein [Synechococcus sp. CS-205]MCT0248369.1 MAPEG family protein [Synechococcus sp. CS-205]